ncbi:MAG: helix-turn-helix transcriptional regulator [Planctomycetes bacterium]|nr:helix-turn-helix transcriptional regulator [Planctomycetota bacterium]
MATVNFGPQSHPATAIPPESLSALTNKPASTEAAEAPNGRGLHRIQTVRMQQGVSLRTVARNTGLDTRTLRDQEDERTDIRLSDLYRWQEVLDVPVSELLVETDSPLSTPVLERARLVRIMKTAAAMREQASTVGMRRMADTLIQQLTEIMPELKDVSAWHTYGQRRSLDEFGRIVERRVSDDVLNSRHDE